MEIELRNDWRPISHYLKHHLTKVCLLKDDTTWLCQTAEGNEYLLRESQGLTLKLYHYEAARIRSDRWSKQPIPAPAGIFNFYYEFEQTPEGKYLISMLPYVFNLTPTAQKKMNTILSGYKDYVHINMIRYKQLAEIVKNATRDKSKWLFEEV